MEDNLDYLFMPDGELHKVPKVTQKKRENCALFGLEGNVGANLIQREKLLPMGPSVMVLVVMLPFRCRCAAVVSVSTVPQRTPDGPAAEQ